MANKRNRPMPSVKGHPTGKKGIEGGSFKESVPNWAGLPGKTGPDRSAGVKKLKTHPQQKGL